LCKTVVCYEQDIIEKKEQWIMRNANEALKVTKAVEKILAVFEDEKLSEEEMRDALKATEVTLGVKPLMPPHHPPMIPEDMSPRPPHIKNC
jgi:hypothetical protein